MWLAEARGNLAAGERGAGRAAAGAVVNAAMKGGQAGHVERYAGQVVMHTGEQAIDACHRDLQFGARSCLVRVRKALGDAPGRGASSGFVRFAGS